MWGDGGRSRHWCCRASGSRRVRWRSCRRAGSNLTEAASVAARSADVQSLRVRNGRLDLDRVRAMAAPLAAVTKALDSAGTAASHAASPWLISPVANKLQVFDQAVDDATFDAGTASEAIAVLPDLLGGNGPRQYFVVFATPSESRDLGGFMGAYGILSANNGKLSLSKTGRVRDLNNAGTDARSPIRPSSPIGS